MRPPLFATKPATLVLRVGLAIGLLTLVPAATRADVIIGNLPAGNAGSFVIGPPQYIAAGFTMGSQAYSLSNVQITLISNAVSPPPSDTAFQLQSNAVGFKPSGTVLFTFTNPTFAPGLNTFTFAAGSPFTLASNTTYWLVGLTGSTEANWVFPDPNITPTGSGASFNAYAQSHDQGATWFGLSTATPEFQLNGTPSVGSPEPSSLVLAGTAACIAAAAGLRRWRVRPV